MNFLSLRELRTRSVDVQKRPLPSRRRFLQHGVASGVTLASMSSLRATEGREPVRGIIAEVCEYKDTTNSGDRKQMLNWCQGYGEGRSSRVEALDPRTGKPVRLLADLGDTAVMGSAALSPDGRFIAASTTDLLLDSGTFGAQREGSASVFVKDIDTKKLVRFSENSTDFIFRELAWRPDGKMLAVSAMLDRKDNARFHTRRNPNDGVWLLALDPDAFALTETQPTFPKWWAPSFSPDGKQMAMERPPSETVRKVVVVGEDGITRELVPGSSAYQPSWSRNGKVLYHGRSEQAVGPYGNFVLHADGPIRPYGLWVVNADGTNRREILPKLCFATVRAAKWSPDGRQIATKVRPDGQPIKGQDEDLIVRVIDLSSRTPMDISGNAVTTARALDNLVWSPDSKQVAFT